MTSSEEARPVLDLLSAMTSESLSRSTLDPDELMIARFAALVAMDAPPASYLLNLAAADAIGFEADKLQAVFVAIAPIVGTARVMSAAGKIARSLGIAIAVADEDLGEADG